MGTLLDRTGYLGRDLTHHDIVSNHTGARLLLGFMEPQSTWVFSSDKREEPHLQWTLLEPVGRDRFAGNTIMTLATVIVITVGEIINSISASKMAGLNWP